MAGVALTWTRPPEQLADTKPPAVVVPRTDADAELAVPLGEGVVGVSVTSAELMSPAFDEVKGWPTRPDAPKPTPTAAAANTAQRASRVKRLGMARSLRDLPLTER